MDRESGSTTMEYKWRVAQERLGCTQHISLEMVELLSEDITQIRTSGTLV